jgi:hypothetical protein
MTGATAGRELFAGQRPGAGSGRHRDSPARFAMGVEYPAWVRATRPRRQNQKRRLILSENVNENMTKVTILTPSFQVKGYINLLPGARVTDFMNESKGFLAVIDAEVREIGEGMRFVQNAPFLNVNRGLIELVIPL